MKRIIFAIIAVSFMVFINSAYAFSFNDVFSWVSNFFGRITGYVTNITDCPYECCLDDPAYTNKVCEDPKTCKDYKCIDVETTTTQISTTTLSSCPYECCSVKDSNYQEKACPYPKNCIEGKCIETTTTQIIPCTDSDDGKNYEVKGTAKDTWGEYTDYCDNERQITEYYCYDSGDGRGPVVWTIGAVDCKYGCKDGACLPMPAPVCGNDICESEEEKANCPQDCYVKCSQGSDCGQQTSYKTCDYAGMPTISKLPGVSYACTVETRYNCENPGTFESKCVDVVGASCIPCQYGCQNGECISGESGEPQVETCNDYDGLDYYLKSYVEYHGNKYLDTCRVINSDTDYYDTNECSGQTCYVLEASCSDFGTPRTQVWECPSNACKDGACTKAEEIKEQVKCIFYNSDILTQPTPAKPYEKCYADLRTAVQAVCTSDGNVAEKNGKKYLYCLVDVAGEKGAKLTWKSSCGGYAYTTIDGNNEIVEFECVPSSNVTPQQISGKGFRYAYWQCYDGTEHKTAQNVDAPCKSAEVWQEVAKGSCKDYCSPETNKCGVNSFSVSQECYIEIKEAVPIPTVPSVEAPKTPQPTKGMLYYFRSDDCPRCLDMDTEIGILKQRGFFNDFGAAIFDTKEDEISQKYEIKTVPTIILYKEGCSFRKEGFIKSDEIVKWAYQAKCEEESILICKDSCPLDGKCYPFGYRKGSKYCSDEGAFKDQLKEDETCENNFECESNVCVSGKCISSSLIQKIIDWFKKLFGME